MSGLLPILGLGFLAAALLWLSGVRGLLLVLACATMLAGGLAFDQHKVERPQSEPAQARRDVPSLAADRHAFTDRFTRSENWLALADSLAARGKTADAAGILIAAVKQNPRDYTLWTGLGTMLTAHGGGLNPGAELAFERAIELAATYPTPRYFYGLAKLQSGDRKGALTEWRAVLASAPADASWRGMVENRIAEGENP